MVQQDSKKVLFLFLAVSSASFSWIWPAAKFFFNNIEWDRFTTTLASILALYLVLMFVLLRGSEFKTHWLTYVMLPTSVLIMHRFINLPSVLSTASFYGRLWFSIIVLTFATKPMRPTSEWSSRIFMLIRWTIYIVLSVPIAVGCYYSSDNWSWIPTVATCVFIELFILSYSDSNTKTKQPTNYHEIAPFLLTLSILLLFTCVSRITLTPTDSKAAPEWTFDEFHERFESNELTDRMIYNNATRIRAGLISDTSRTRPDYRRSPLIFWFYDDIIGIPALASLLRATYPKTKQSAVQLYNTFFDDTMIGDNLFGNNVQYYNVDITQREISITELSNETGSVEIHEAYTTPRGWNLEVVYLFNLPENCVLTGVWLQEIPKDAKPNKFHGHKYLVSPRGAAQRVYNKLKERRVDPALLEQVGPVQYRLKIYPIPNYNNAMHMWMTYEFMKTQNGDIPLPKLLRVEGANTPSLKDTTVLFNGSQSIYESTGEVDGWLPELTVKLPRNKDAQSSTMKINNERVVVASNDQKLFDPETVTVAVVVDASYSMRTYENSVLEAITKLQQKFDSVDVFSARRRVTQCTMTECLPDPTSFMKLKLPLKKKDIIFLGSTNFDDLVLSKAYLNATYDITILLTDDGTIDPYYKRSEKHQGLSRGDFWMVHLNGKHPIKFQDFTTEALFINDAKAVLSVDDVIARYVPGRDSLHETDMKPCNESLSKFAAKKYMQKYLRENRPHVDEEGEAINPLERVHEMAIKHSILTPYSSMIVLINRAQKDMLEIEEDKDNKFERKMEVDERYSSWQWNFLFSSAPSQLPSAVPTLIFIFIIWLTVLFYGF